MIITLDMQIAAARRESMLRRRVYPGWVGSGRMKQAEADKEIAAMEAIEATLIELRETGKLVWPFVDSGKTERTKPMMSEDGPSHSPSMTFEQRVEKSSRVCFVDYDGDYALLDYVGRETYTPLHEGESQGHNVSFNRGGQPSLHESPAQKTETAPEAVHPALGGTHCCACSRDREADRQTALEGAR